MAFHFSVTDSWPAVDAPSVGATAERPGPAARSRPEPWLKLPARSNAANSELGLRVIAIGAGVQLRGVGRQRRPR